MFCLEEADGCELSYMKVLVSLVRWSTGISSLRCKATWKKTDTEHGPSVMLSLYKQKRHTPYHGATWLDGSPGQTILHIAYEEHIPLGIAGSDIPGHPSMRYLNLENIVLCYLG
jgi:hypothetical protein